MCIDILEIWFGIAHWQISSIFDRVICQRHDNGRVLSFHIFILNDKLFYLKSFFLILDCPSITLSDFLKGICKVEDCQTITCVLDVFFNMAKVNIFLQFRLQCETVLNYQLENKVWQKNLNVLAKG